MSTSKVLLGILAGFAAGAAIGVLLAPDSGANTRKKILNKSQDMADDLKDKWDHAVDSLKDEKNHLRQEADKIVSKVRHKVEEMGRKAEEVNS